MIIVPRKISNSEVGTWLSCRRKYYYKFDLNITPIKTGVALGRGVMFHAAMEAFNKNYINTKNFNDAKLVGMIYIKDQLANVSEYEQSTTMDVYRIYENYMGVLQERINEWDILEAEEDYDMPINEHYSMPMRLDLLIRERATDEICLVDYKTCYDFWSEDQIALSPQAAKYIGSLRTNGKLVDKLILEQVRYRSIKDPSPEQLFRRTTIRPSVAKIRNVLRDHITASNSITQYRNLEADQRDNLATRVMNPMICKGCEVRELCKSELDGGSIDYMIATDYKKNSYGYNQVARENVLELL